MSQVRLFAMVQDLGSGLIPQQQSGIPVIALRVYKRTESDSDISPASEIESDFGAWSGYRRG